jgi:HEAT repeat protein
MKMAWILLLTMTVGGSLSRGQSSDGRSAVELAFSQLKDEGTANQAANRLQTMAKSNPNVQAYLSTNLPPVIEEHTRGNVWLNAVRLAGDLKIVSAVDALVAALGENNKGGPLTFAEEDRLDNDPPAKALAEIGDPAVPAVAHALESPDKSIRWRAARALGNVKSPSARTALMDHLANEPDARLRAFIQDAIDRSAHAGR